MQKFTYQRNFTLVVVFLGIVLLLVSCGSGGGGRDVDKPSELYDSISPASYNGKTTQAVITSQNALNLFLSAWNGGPATTVSSSQNINSSSIMLSQLIPKAEAFNGAHGAGLLNSVFDKTVDIQKTEHGIVSGTVKYSGYRNEDCTGEVNIVYENYNNGEGITYHGSSTMTVLSCDVYKEPTEVDINMSALTFHTATSYYTLTGTIKETSDPKSNSETRICNFDGRNEVSMDTFRLENFIIEKTCNNFFSPTVCSDSASGRLYIASEGYVDLDQINPFVYNYYGQFNEDVPDSGGPLLVNGANGSKMKVIPLSLDKLQVEVDSDGDNTFETINEYLWTELADFAFSWEKTIGTSGYDAARSIQETIDGGYIIAGTTNTSGGNRTDFYLVKINFIGDIEWEKTFGGVNDDIAHSVKEAPDGGYIITGYSETFPSIMGKDIFIIKTDTDGNLEWQKTFDTIYHESMSYDVQVTSDDNYIIVGSVRPEHLSYARDVYLLKLALSGDVIWDKMYSSNVLNSGYSVQETSDGGYIVVGDTDARDRNGTDIYLIKTDQDGNLLWDRSFGGTGEDFGYTVREFIGGGYIISGRVAYDTYLLRTDADGNIIWEKTLWNSYRSYWSNSVQVTHDGGFIISGTEDRNVVLMKLDTNGEQQWDRSFNWSRFFRESSAFDVQKTSDGGYIVTGSTETSEEEKNIYLIKTDSEGKI